VSDVNFNVSTVNMSEYNARMTPRAPKTVKKPRDQYHHGDLRRSLIQAAVRTIQKHGFEALTLRAVADELGVSRTALYRHFHDKSALLTAVASEGFVVLRSALVAAWEQSGRGQLGLQAMGEAYVRFAIAHPWHYRVMFGGGFELNVSDPQLAESGSAAFSALVDALVEQQSHGTVRGDEPKIQANFVWGLVHGLAMLAIDGNLEHQGVDATTLVRYAMERLRTGIGV
jgi:AcrR family transcriptional regulator